MSLPAYQVLAPAVHDDLMYAVGAHVGTDVAAAAWECDGSTYMLSELLTYGAHAGQSTWTEIDGGTFRVAARREAFGPDQWNASQCVIPLDSDSGIFPGVRCTPSTKSGYFLSNFGTTDWSPNRFILSLYRCVNGVLALLGSWQVPGSTGNQGVIDGRNYTDGVLCMLEVAGSSPVQLRASIIVPKGQMVADLTALPADVPLGNSGQPAALVLGTVNDGAASRILSGRPGILMNGYNPAGGLYGFNAGEFPAPPEMSATAGAAVQTRSSAAAQAGSAVQGARAAAAQAGSSVAAPHAADAAAGSTVQAGAVVQAWSGAAIEAVRQASVMVGASVVGAAPPGPVLKRWNGREYVPVILKRWSGAAYAPVQLKRG